jgi:hypothetical protein
MVVEEDEPENLNRFKKKKEDVRFPSQSVPTPLEQVGS